MNAEISNSIYLEAVAFILVFFIMSVISYRISSRHAKEYAIKNQEKMQARREAKKDEVQSKEDRIVELQNMLNSKIITEDEFLMMKKSLYNTQV